jgi:uncharacterized protein YkwD
MAYQRPSSPNLLSLSILVGLLLILLAYAFFAGRIDNAGVLEDTTAVAPITTTPSATSTSPLTQAKFTATIAPAVTQPPTPTVQQLPDFTVLQAQALDLLNQDRQAHSLQPVAWDSVAATAAARHTEDMIQHGYFSHWNLQGLGPDHRYTLAGGTHIAAENLHIFSYTFSDGRGAPIENWPDIIERAQLGLMNSPGHRATILDPAHTHVGIGMAYDAAKGQFTLAQVFTRHYVQLARPLPLQVRLGEQITLQGEVVGAAVEDALLNLAYEPFPEPLTLDFLNQTTTYRAAAVNVAAWLLSPAFEQEIVLDHDGRAGLYHIRIFLDLPTGQTQVLNHVITVHE